MEYIKDFLDVASYEAYIQSEEAVFPNVSLTESDNVVHYNKGVPVPPVPPIDYRSMPLTIEITDSNEGEITIYLSYANDAELSYSLNGGAWTPINSAVYLTVNNGDKIQLVGVDNEYGTSSPAQSLLNTDLNFIVYGNVMSLLDKTNFANLTTFPYNNNPLKSLFANNIGLISAENLILPATALTDNCYEQMFYYCIRLTTAPELPATVLGEQCYASMFDYCRSLTTAPVLPATTLAEECYAKMFYDCASLNSVTCLATDLSAYDCTYNWLYGVASSGTFTKASSADWSRKTGYSGIPSGWTTQDAS